jgi:hypothetical protein
MKKYVQIRYNTQVKSGEDFHWRLIIDGVETLVHSIKVNVPTWTTQDFIENVGEKWHISCLCDEVIIVNNHAQLY